MARAYAEGKAIGDAPLPLLLDMFLTRYPGYTASELLAEDFHIVEALLDIALAFNDERADDI
ncbi:MAG: hypothetical protein H5T86_11320 [Armatimonadetes bacterium]|nr:hypothetical protein [Armatimonadota bacterium]